MRSVRFFCGRVVFLFVIAIVIFYFTVDQLKLKAKTLNFLMPDAASIKKFNEQPELMDREELNDLLIYYKKVCDFQGNDPEYPAPCSFAAYAYYYLGQTEKAVEHYEKSLQGNPHFFWSQYNLALIHYNEGLYEQAAREFHKASDLPVENAVYFMLLTKTYKDATSLLKINNELLLTNLQEGYEHAGQLSAVSKLIGSNPELKERLRIKKLKLRLF